MAMPATAKSRGTSIAYRLPMRYPLGVVMSVIPREAARSGGNPSEKLDKASLSFMDGQTVTVSSPSRKMATTQTSRVRR